MITAIAVDDEPIALDVVRAHAAKVPFVDLKICFTNAFEAIAFLQHNTVDLIFLDIKMPDITGLDFVKSIKDPPMVVFTTAYSEHAVNSFELDAVDYLLKPFSLSRFLKACNKAHELHLLRNPVAQVVEPEWIFIKDGYEQVRVYLDDIIYVEAGGNYTKVHMSADRSLSTRITINDMASLLPSDKFVRVHRAFIVSRKYITRFNKTQLVVNNQVLPIGATYAGCI